MAPINDPKLSVHWLKNGQPLPDANRFRQGFEFGFVTLDILYAYAEDNGDYELVVTNDKGQASTRTHIGEKKYDFEKKTKIVLEIIIYNLYQNSSQN